MSNLMSWALKRALRVLIIVCASRRLLRIVRLIRRPIILNIIVSAALREVSASERFRRGLEELRTLLDFDPRLVLPLETRAETSSLDAASGFRNGCRVDWIKPGF